MEKEESIRIFNNIKVRWAVASHKPYNSQGGDRIFQALLQQGLEELLPLRVSLFSFSIAYIPKRWRDIKIVFIPNAGR